MTKRTQLNSGVVKTCTKLISFAVVGLVGLGACQSESRPDPRRNLITQWVDGALMEGYAELVHATQSLAAQSQAYCAEPNTADWEQLKFFWWRARAPWKRNEVFAFGPYSENPWRLNAKIDFWPARPETIEKTLAATDIELTPQRIAQLGASATGMPALEYLLFREGAQEKSLEPRTCAYIVGLSIDLVTDSTAMYRAWAPDGENYRAELVFADASTAAFEDLDDAMAQVVNRMGFTLSNIRRDKLSKVLGTAQGGPYPQLAESRWSGRAIEDIRDNLRGMERLVFGPQGRFHYAPLRLNRSAWTGFPTNLVQMLEYRGFYLYRPLRSRFDEAYAALDAIPGSLTKAAQEHPEQVRAAIDALGRLQALIQGDVLKNLALSITFNDADGD